MLQGRREEGGKSAYSEEADAAKAEAQAVFTGKPWEEHMPKITKPKRKKVKVKHGSFRDAWDFEMDFNPEIDGIPKDFPSEFIIPAKIDEAAIKKHVNKEKGEVDIPGITPVKLIVSTT